MRGIEIAPWMLPLVPCFEGYDVKVVDVFDRKTLLERALADRNLKGRDPSTLQEVDYVGSATEIADLVPTNLLGTFDYIVSSHNFEHLPNPIKFLQGCEVVLKHGGVLSLAVPDRRAHFDYFRPNTVIGDWLDAYAEDRKRPTRRQVFDYWSHFALLHEGKARSLRFHLGVVPGNVLPAHDLVDAYGVYRSEQSPEYVDAHCTVMTPASLQLLLTEVRQLGLARYSIEHVSTVSGCEFFCRLRFDGTGPMSDPARFSRERSLLMQQVTGEYIPQTVPGLSARLTNLKRRVVLATMDTSRAVRRLGRRLRGRRG